MNSIFFLTGQNKGIAYHLSYWITALLPVILGFGITIFLIWLFTKTYKGDRENDGFIGERKNKDKN